MLNDCKVMGRLTKDCELKKFESGTSFTSGTIACERNYKNRDGKYDTDFIKFTASGKTAEFISKYFHKGEFILVEGELRPREYDAEGIHREITEVNVRQAYFCGAKASRTEPVDTTNDADFKEIPDSDDLPF